MRSEVLRICGRTPGMFFCKPVQEPGFMEMNMKNPNRYMEYAVEYACALLAIDSPTGYTKEAADYVLDAFEKLGIPARRTVKGGILADLGGQDDRDALFLEAHIDTLGGMVSEILGSGRLRIVPLGGLPAPVVETEN